MLHHCRSLLHLLGLDKTRCPVCAVVTDKSHGSLCLACADELRPRTIGLCPSCGTMYGDDTAQPTLCGECRHTPPPWDNLHFHGKYEGKLRELILNYKFNGGVGTTHLLADMAQRAFDTPDARLPDIIIPVPLHTRRLLKRGFNQSTEISRILGRALDKPILTDGLIRTRHTPPQTSLGHTERQENIKDAFEADATKVKGKIALLVDDVYTTGATLTECTRTLKRAGASGVDVLVLARTQQD